MRNILTCLLFLFSICASAFEPDIETLEQYLSAMAEEETDETETDINDRIEDLSERLSFGIDLNTISKRELNELGLLSPKAVNEIVSYRQIYGGFTTIYELKNIRSLTNSELNLLKPIVYASNEQSNKHATKIESSSFYSRVLETRKGYTQASTNPYIGDANRFVQKLTIQRDKKLRLGLVAEKDAGELYYHRGWMPMDHCSGHIEVNDCKTFKRIILGDYRLMFGSGLVLGNSFIFKQQTNNSRNGISHYAGTSESGFLRGFATELEFRKVRVTPFISYHTIDATINPDSSFSSFYTSGLHRTELERSKADNMSELISGGNVSFSINKFSVGTTFAYYKFSRPYIPQDKLYNYYKPTNSDHGNNMSINYSYNGKVAGLTGEISKSSNGDGFAVINQLHLSRNGFVDAHITHRYYSPEYFAPYANTVRENTKVENEHGLLTAIDFHLSRKFAINLYADLFSFEWLKYGVSAPSLGKDFSVQTKFLPNGNNELSVRYRFKYKEKDFDHSLSTFETNSVRLHYKAKPSSWLTTKTTINWNTCSRDKRENTYGFHIQENLTLSIPSNRFSFSMLYAYFSAKDYNNRIYCYETEIPGYFYSPMNYGVGHRFGCLFSFKFNKIMSLYAKYSRISYIDGRTTISASGEEISGNNKSEIRASIKLRW